MNTAVANRRHRIGRAAASPIEDLGQKGEEALLGTASDKEIARRSDRNVAVVASAGKSWRFPIFTGRIAAVANATGENQRMLARHDVVTVSA